MKISILTFDGFNELDSIIAFSILSRVKQGNWQVQICSPSHTVTSMNGLVLTAQSTLSDISSSDVVLVGSGVKTREVVANTPLMESLLLDPNKQLIGAQCSGTLVLAKLGLLQDIPACTDLTTKPWVQECNISVLNQPFYAKGNIATAGGCLASHYLATWVIARTIGLEAAQEAIHYVAPVGEKEQYVQRALANISPYL